MLKVCLESPFRPTDAEVAQYAGRFTRSELLRQNLVYARLALLDALRRGEAPIASHLLYTQVWAESDELRNAGIKAGIEWAHRADRVVLYVDLGLSNGMKLGRDNAKLINVACEERALFNARERDPREALAVEDLGTFPYLEELRALEYAERTASGKVRLS